MDGAERAGPLRDLPGLAQQTRPEPARVLLGHVRYRLVFAIERQCGEPSKPGPNLLLGLTRRVSLPEPRFQHLG